MLEKSLAGIGINERLNLEFQKDTHWIVTAFKYLGHLNKWDSICITLSDEQSSKLAAAYSDCLKENTATKDEIFTMLNVGKFTDLNTYQELLEKPHAFTETYDQLIAGCLFYCERDNPMQGIDNIKRALEKKKLETKDFEALTIILNLIISSVQRTYGNHINSQKEKIKKANKILSNIHKIIEDLDKRLVSLNNQDKGGERIIDSYIQAVRSRTFTIFDTLEWKISNSKNKDSLPLMLNLKHREEILVEQESLLNLTESKIDSYYRASSDCYYTSNLNQQDIPESITKKYSSRFLERRTRVPYIAISKYHNASILRHQFIITADEYGSMDSQEELVIEDDIIWYYQKSTISIKSQSYCIPRLSSQDFSVNPRTVKIDKNEKRIAITKPCIYIPAWYATNISHWLIDVLPRIYLAKKYLKTSLKYLLPKGPSKTAEETLSLLNINKNDVIWHENNVDVDIAEMYTISRMASMYNYFSEEFFDFYEQLKESTLKKYNISSENACKKIYISRSDSNRRICTNESTLETKLKEIGFKIVVLRDMPFIDRIKVFSNCEIVIGASGAGLTHMLFMNKLTNMLILGSEEMHQNTSVFSKIAMHKHIKLKILSSAAADSKNINSQWTADIDAILEYTKEIMCKK